jgi:hypothetical protein
MISFTTHESDVWTLTDEGREIASHGSHEVKVFNAVPSGADGISLAELQVCHHVALFHPWTIWIS